MSASTTSHRNEGGGFGLPFSTEMWPFRQEWLDWARAAWVPGGRVQQQKDDHPARLSFVEAAASAFKGRCSFRHIKTWVSVQKPEFGGGYAYGFPHTHQPAHGLTLVHYLQPGDMPAPLIIGEHRVIPEPGLTVFMPNTLEHGVLKNNGTLDRIQLIATAL